jgi:sugar phosphate isomerase/epimerase
MDDLSRLSINQVTTRGQWNLAQAIEAYARHQVPGIGIFRDMLDDCGTQKAVGLIRDTGLEVASLCAGGRFAAADQSNWQSCIDDNRRAIDDADKLGAQCLVLIGGGLPPGSKDLPGARARYRDGVAKILDEATAAGVRLGIEPQHPMSAADRGCISTLAQANDICDALGDKAGDTVGIVFDLYHLWWEPGVEEQIARARGRFCLFHLNDWLSPTDATRNQRGMMGDGVIDIPRLRGLIEDAGYDGFNEVEIMNSELWKMDPDDLVRLCIERYRSVV